MRFSTNHLCTVIVAIFLCSPLYAQEACPESVKKAVFEALKAAKAKHAFELQCDADNIVEATPALEKELPPMIVNLVLELDRIDTISLEALTAEAHKKALPWLVKGAEMGRYARDTEQELKIARETAERQKHQAAKIATIVVTDYRFLDTTSFTVAPIDVVASAYEADGTVTADGLELWVDAVHENLFGAFDVEGTTKTLRFWSGEAKHHVKDMLQGGLAYSRNKPMPVGETAATPVKSALEK